MEMTAPDRTHRRVAHTRVRHGGPGQVIVRAHFDQVVAHAGGHAPQRVRIPLRLQILGGVVHVIRLVAPDRARNTELVADVIEIPLARFLEIVVGDAADNLQRRSAHLAHIAHMRVHAPEGAIEGDHAAWI